MNNCELIVLHYTGSNNKKLIQIIELKWNQRTSICIYSHGFSEQGQTENSSTLHLNDYIKLFKKKFHPKNTTQWKYLIFVCLFQVILSTVTFLFSHRFI